MKPQARNWSLWLSSRLMVDADVEARKIILTSHATPKTGEATVRLDEEELRAFLHWVAELKTQGAWQ